ncbi:uncharacterized protein EV154DRAFT_484068 [Mucor mucedo]|uniref:uncharacterized protein n=1 Tax=Mucor mucedo TaxID=29922 RepID=UPI0022210F51|nr:uncharacterized protein EV154DRAFT_484068 [Mucor mucedo]KAI7888466.1 hypothetical protein EV154DRAFT_484068 [Mucor mucedo]
MFLVKDINENQTLAKLAWTKTPKKWFRAMSHVTSTFKGMGSEEKSNLQSLRRYYLFSCSDAETGKAREYTGRVEDFINIKEIISKFKGFYTLKATAAKENRLKNLSSCRRTFPKRSLTPLTAVTSTPSLNLSNNHAITFVLVRYDSQAYNQHYCNFEIAKELVVLTGHIIKYKLTIIKYPPEYGSRWVTFEVRYCKVPLAHQEDVMIV